MIRRFCRLARRSFSDRLDGQPIAWWRALLVRVHLRACPTCIRYNRALSSTRTALAALRDRDPE